MSHEVRSIPRRRFLEAAAGASLTLVAAPRLGGAEAKEAKKLQVQTVLGPIDAEALGTTLAHEHVLVDFIGAEKFSRERYDAAAVHAKALPHLKRVRELGGRGFVECTPAYLGRDPELLVRLAKDSGLHIITNTGYYGAGDNKYLPKHAFTETADALAARWLKEWREGIEGSGVKPGFVKIGVGGESLSELHQKLVRAAARTHLESGLAIAAHTGPGALALEELEILRAEGAGGAAFIWVHAQAESDRELWLRAADRGAWISLDGFGEKETERYVEWLKFLRDRRRLDRVLLSHDAGWYRPGEPDGGEYRPHDAIFKTLLPRLRKEGFSEDDIAGLMAANPREAFAIRKRPRE